MARLILSTLVSWQLTGPDNMRYLLLLLLLLPSGVNAASLHVDAVQESLRVGDTALVTVSLYTEGDIVNAIDGTILIPDSLVVTDIRYSGSVVSLWIQNPEEREVGRISFGAVLPGGYQNGVEEETQEGNVFTFVVEAVQEGETSISFTDDTAVYLNDGAGTRAPLTVKNSTLTVGAPDGSTQRVAVSTDDAPPEDFTAEVTSGDAFGIPGEVLVFLASDKDSGVERYEISRSYVPFLFLSWGGTESPAQLHASDAYGFVAIRAIDRSGNETVTIATPGGMRAWLPTLIVVLILAIISTLLLRRRGIIRKG